MASQGARLRVLILWASDASPNLGLRALAAGTEALVRRRWPDAEVLVHDYGARSAPVRVGTHRAAIKERLTGSGGLVPWLETFDLVIDTRSGDSFADIYGLNRQFVMTMMGDAVRRAGVPLMLGPQTIGPFDTLRGKAMARWTLRSADLVMARDSASATAAARLGRPVDVTATDVVFAMPATAQPTTRDVLLNVSGLLWQESPHLDASAYRRIIQELVRALVDRGREVTLFAHVLDSSNPDNDVLVLDDVRVAVGRPVDTLIPADLEDARVAVGASNAVIGSRMHACLNSLSMGTPALPLAYSRKFAPLMADLGWHRTIDLWRETDVVASALAFLDDPDLGRDVAMARQRADQRLERAASLLPSVIR